MGTTSLTVTTGGDAAKEGINTADVQSVPKERVEDFIREGYRSEAIKDMN